jgi:uncharacterized membrane protein
MIDIVPNPHPIFVHFTVALLMVATFFHLLASIDGARRAQWLVVARWNLWLGTILTVGTALSGLDAYNTVAHDAPSHAAMTDHRNWAVATLVFFLVLAVWSLVQARAGKATGAPFVTALLVASLVLGSTAWRGGELVYRYGLGVRSLPAAEADGHPHAANGHDHGHGDDAGGTPPRDFSDLERADHGDHDRTH